MTEPEEIARDIVVALLADSGPETLERLAQDGDPAAAGEALGDLYLGVLRTIDGGTAPRPEEEEPARGRPTGPAGGDLTGRYPDPSIADGVITAPKFGTLPAVDASRANRDQTIPDGAETPVVYNGEAYDTADLHPDSVNGDSRFTAPVDGLYFVRASVRWASGGPGTRRLLIRRNGGSNEATHEYTPDAAGRPFMHSISTIVHLNAGDFVEAIVTQTSGDDLDVALGVDTSFSMLWLAPPPF